MASLIRYVAAAKWRPVPLFVAGKVLDAQHDAIGLEPSEDACKRSSRRPPLLSPQVLDASGLEMSEAAEACCRNSSTLELAVETNSQLKAALRNVSMTMVAPASLLMDPGECR